MSYTTPTADDFKTYFERDFPYGTDITTSVTDTDIGKALVQTDLQINDELFANQNIFDIGFLLLSAHYLVMNLQASSQGSQGQFDWLVSSKSVGNVSQTASIPDRILANPEYAWLTKTPYGTQYLMMILPQLSGQIFVVAGQTLP